MEVRPADLVSTLLARRREDRERERTRAFVLRAQLLREVATLRSAGLLEAAWLIGSLAWGSFGERSDVDVVARGVAREHVSTIHGRLIDALATERIDLLRLEDLAPAFRARVLSDGMRLDEP